MREIKKSIIFLVKEGWVKSIEREGQDMKRIIN